MNPTMAYEHASDGIHTTGRVVFLLAVSSLLAATLCTLVFFAVLTSDSGSVGWIASMGSVLGPRLRVVAFIAFAIEFLALGTLAIGAVRWRYRGLANPLWIASLVCAACALVLMNALTFFYLVIATSYVECDVDGKAGLCIGVAAGGFPFSRAPGVRNPPEETDQGFG